jgi:hypothetical protein
MLTHAGPHHPQLIELLAERGDNVIAPTLPTYVRVARRRNPAIPIVFAVVGVTMLFGAIAAGGRQLTGSVNPLDWPDGGLTRLAHSATQLEDLMVEAPDGYATAPADFGFDAGRIDKAEAKADETVPAAALAIESGFVRGHDAAWARGRTQFLAVGVYQFRDAEAAKAYEAPNLANPLVGEIRMVPTKAPDVPGAHAFTYTSSDNPVAIEAVIYQRDAYVVMVVAGGTDGSEAARPLADLATAQHRRLSKAPWNERLF